MLVIPRFALDSDPATDELLLRLRCKFVIEGSSQDKGKDLDKNYIFACLVQFITGLHTDKTGTDDNDLLKAGQNGPAGRQGRSYPWVS